LSKLEHLYIGANNFSGFIPQSIGNLLRLKKLDTIQNNLFGPIPQSIWNQSSLEYLALSHNYLSGTPNSDIMRHICNISFHNNRGTYDILKI
jgi:Leucine-rich repeat (LRR) protein